VVSATDRPEERTDHRGPAEVLVTLAQLVVAGADFRRLTREPARATAMALSADRCEVLRLVPDGGRLLRVAVSGEGATPDDDTSAVPSGVSSAAGYALLCGAPILSRNLKEERRFGIAGAPPWGSPVSAVAAPVPGRASDFGALVLYAARPGAFDERHTLSAARTASLLGGAFDSRRAATPCQIHNGLPGPNPRRSTPMQARTTHQIAGRDCTPLHCGIPPGVASNGCGGPV
jgi:GAF domain-containing protein